MRHVRRRRGRRLASLLARTCSSCSTSGPASRLRSRAALLPGMLQHYSGLSRRPVPGRAGGPRRRALAAVGRACLYLGKLTVSPPAAPATGLAARPAGLRGMPGSPARPGLQLDAAHLAAAEEDDDIGARVSRATHPRTPTTPSPHPAARKRDPSDIFRVPSHSIHPSHVGTRPQYVFDDAETVHRRAKLHKLWLRMASYGVPMRACRWSIDRRIRRYIPPFKTFRQYVQWLEMFGLLPIGSTKLARKALLAVIAVSPGARPATHVPRRNLQPTCTRPRIRDSNARPVFD